MAEGPPLRPARSGPAKDEEHTMAKLVTASQFANPDAAYVLLAKAHRGLTDAEAAAFNARLLLLLANHIGDTAILEEAIALAKQP
jgi:predicted metal-dependent hydrolase